MKHSKTSPFFDIVGEAQFSSDMLYRYLLHRKWRLAETDRRIFTVAGLNPSTATATEDDPTIRRSYGFAERENFNEYRMLNLYGFRSTDPKGLVGLTDPFGLDNLKAHEIAFQYSARTGAPIVCAWGMNADPAHAADFIARGQRIGARLVCFGKTKNGSPKHPLYLKADTPLLAFP